MMPMIHWYKTYLNKSQEAVGAQGINPSAENGDWNMPHRPRPAIGLIHHNDDENLPPTILTVVS